MYHIYLLPFTTAESSMYVNFLCLSLQTHVCFIFIVRRCYSIMKETTHYSSTVFQYIISSDPFCLWVLIYALSWFLGSRFLLFTSLLSSVSSHYTLKMSDTVLLSPFVFLRVLENTCNNTLVRLHSLQNYLDKLDPTVFSSSQTNGVIFC